MKIHDYVEYKDGNLYWSRKIERNARMGVPIGSDDGTGYICKRFDGKKCSVHRVIWEMHNGGIPKGMEIDHIDHDRKNNRIENIRLVKRQVYMMNKSMYHTNSTGVTGVSYSKSKSAYVAYMQHDGVNILLKTSKSIEVAIEARKAAEVKYGFHSNHGL